MKSFELADLMFKPGSGVRASMHPGVTGPDLLMLGRWEALERKRVEEDKARAAAEYSEIASTSSAVEGQSASERLAKERQLFDQGEAFSAPLLRSLVSMITTCQGLGFNAVVDFF